MNIVTVSSKNQIAIPVSYLRDLDFWPGDKLIMERKDDAISLKPVKSSVTESLSGSLRKLISPTKQKVAWDKIVRQAKKAKAYAQTDN